MLYYLMPLVGTAVLLFLAWRQNHDHLTPFHLRHLLNRSVILKIGSDSLDLPHSDLLVRHFATTETQCNFDLILFLQEASHVAQLDLVIVFVSAWTKLDLLDLNLLLLELLLVLSLLFLVFEFAVIHDSANGRLSVRTDLDQIHSGFKGQVQGILDGGDTNGLTVQTSQTNFFQTDLFIDPVSAGLRLLAQFFSAFYSLFLHFLLSAGLNFLG